MKMRYTISNVTCNLGEDIAKAATYADAVTIANALAKARTSAKLYVYEHGHYSPCYEVERTEGTQRAAAYGETVNAR